MQQELRRKALLNLSTAEPNTLAAATQALACVAPDGRHRLAFIEWAFGDSSGLTQGQAQAIIELFPYYRDKRGTAIATRDARNSWALIYASYIHTLSTGGFNHATADS